ncbi:MAG TPA: hypothetical protein VHG89_10275 [Verrucomicrobiae bacterium]|nr:hypothetical protein [Verrucomicrobiae bacterium]
MEELAQVRALAKKENAILYCWKTTNISNWLEKGISISDVLGIVVLPKGLPEQIDLPDDSRKAI